MIVLRLEEPSGKGVYHSPGTFPVLNETPSYEHPMPFDDDFLVNNYRARTGRDIIDHFGNNFVFCFNSISQLIKWFSRESIFKLHSSGVVISVYNSDSVIEGYSQCLIPKSDHINPIKRFTMLEFLDELSQIQ